MKKIYKLVVIALIVCLSTSLRAQTAGTLTFKIGDATHSSTYSGTKRVLSVWVEYNSTGTTWTFVKTLFQKGRSVPTSHTPTWTSASASNVTGAVSSTASFAWTAGTLQTITWNGQNVSNVVVADGNYRVAVEETWDHGTTGTAVAYFPFTKGATASTTNPTSASFTNLTVTWAPTMATEEFKQAPQVVMYPNPSKGLLTIDLKSDVKNIQVVNILGDVVYNEAIDSTFSGTTKVINLSNFTNGVYIVSVSNDSGTTTEKIVLDK